VLANVRVVVDDDDGENACVWTAPPPMRIAFNRSVDSFMVVNVL